MSLRRLPSTAPKRTRRAFTFIDLTISVLILGILAAVASPKFIAALNKQRVEAAAERVRADLQLARTTALALSTSQSVAFDPATETYLAAGLANVNRPGAAYSVDLSDSPYAADIVSADFGGSATVVFDHYGAPDHGGVVTFGSGSYQQTVTLWAETGRASIP
ncbi:MAG: hypothetical protein KDA44_00490 [Planctomycetales bacterium]|nr:hypothetical protein [Planctomycetales bacterium]